jgi:glycosyltransferase involved in cell wall biosynthesis
VDAIETVRGKLGPAADRPLVVHVGNGFFYKNDRGVVEALAALIQRVPGLTLVRLGPRLPAELEALLPPDRILYLRPRSGVEVAALYRIASVLVAPSWDEGFGWPPLEAMACGCPVVSSACGALAETAAPAALVVDPADRAALGAAVARVLSEPALREELCGRGLAHSAAFRWEHACRSMAEIYEEVAACA